MLEVFDDCANERYVRHASVKDGQSDTASIEYQQASKKFSRIEKFDVVAEFVLLLFLRRKNN